MDLATQVPKHNMVNEHMFGGVDNYLRSSLRSTRQRSLEGVCLCRFNCMAPWLQKLPVDDQQTLVNLAMRAVPHVRETQELHEAADRQVHNS